MIFERKKPEDDPYQGLTTERSQELWESRPGRMWKQK